VAATDDAGMSKRAVLWMVGLIAFGFTYIAAVNVSELRPGSFGSSRVCEGMWNFTEWFASYYCSELLPPRLGVLALGLVVLLVCGYFAEKSKRDILAAGHQGDTDGSGSWVCQECDFKAPYYSTDVNRHQKATGRARLASTNVGTAQSHAPTVPTPMIEPPVKTYGFDNSAKEPAIAPEPASTTADSKTCPDCAEEVRAAARKCRFCGYIFEDVTTPLQG
jgi:hypothetical protein